MNTGASSEVFHEDRLELLLFSLRGNQRFGINVLKVKEVIACPPLTQLPDAHPAVRGVSHLRGEPMTVIDLSQAIGSLPLTFVAGEKNQGSVIVTEFNRSKQGFLIGGIDRIIVFDWKDILPPPRSTVDAGYITGVTMVDDELIQLLDVECILGEVAGEDNTQDTHLDDVNSDILSAMKGKRILIVDDSKMARKQTAQALDELGVVYSMAGDGAEAIKMLADDDFNVDMVISDIEMPEMDGYSLTREIRKLEHFSDLYVLLHTSLNGAINEEKAQRSGANDVLTKFVPDELVHAVVKGFAKAS
ncbi:MAG: chemotaxis protein CheV [Gammaproteobacteria bacterium]|nr:chemotaxis protein CheV [Gammaproteobacteria bacterium]